MSIKMRVKHLCGEDLTDYPRDTKFCGKCGKLIDWQVIEGAEAIFKLKKYEERDKQGGYD